MSKKRDASEELRGKGRPATEHGRLSVSARGRAQGASAPDSFSVSNDAVWQAVRSPLRLQVLEAIRAAPGIDARALSKALNTSAPRLYYHLNILMQCGLIVGVENAGAGGRRPTARGPEALAYRAHSADFPQGFFGANDDGHERREVLLRALFDGGLEVALSSKSRSKSAVHAVVRREHLTPSEATKVKALLRQIDEVLEGARKRRHSESKLVPATHFVGSTFCEIDGELPDGPLDGH